MRIDKLREMLKSYGLDYSIVVNKISKKYSIILDNNVIATGNPKERVVMFRPIPDGKSTYCMERDKFYTEFEEAFDDDKAIEAVGQYFENNKNRKS